MTPKILVFDLEIKDIIGYEGRYKIYSDGRVWSHLSERFLALTINHKEYIQIKIYLKNNIYISKKLHILLTKHFIPNPSNPKTTNHKNKNRQNNSLSNLEWLSLEDNVKHGLQKLYKVVSPESVVVEFRGQAEFCRENNLTQPNFSKMLLGKRTKCKGWTRVTT